MVFIWTRSLEKKIWKRNVTLLAPPDVLACTSDKPLDVKTPSEWGGTTILRLSSDSDDAVTVIVSSDKFKIFTVPIGKMDLPACDAEAKREPFKSFVGKSHH